MKDVHSTDVGGCFRGLTPTDELIQETDVSEEGCRIPHPTFQRIVVGLDPLSPALFVPACA